MRSPFLALIAGLALAGCATAPEPPPPPVTTAPAAPGIAAEDLVGRWGFASFNKESDRARTITQARGHCNNAYVITRGPTGGVMMHLPDQRAPSELRTKAGPGGTRYLGPEGPAGDAADREIISFDGRMLTMRWIDPEVASRYGTAVYVRCAPRV
jgi:hypothetical protein